MGRAGEAKNPTHQLKKLDTGADPRVPRPLQHPDSGRQARGACRSSSRPTTRPRCSTCSSGARRWAASCRSGGRTADEKLKVPDARGFQPVLEATADGREISTTQAFVRLLTLLTRDSEIGPRVVPIVPDEARTFGMEGMFRQLGIYAPDGQKYTPVDKDQVMYYRRTPRARSSRRASTRPAHSARGSRRRRRTPPTTGS